MYITKKDITKVMSFYKKKLKKKYERFWNQVINLIQIDDVKF